MCKDKQNTYQHTPKQLRRKCEGLLKSSLYQKYTEMFPELVSSNEVEVSWISQCISSHTLKIFWKYLFFPVIFCSQETNQINGNGDCRWKISFRQSVNAQDIKIIILVNRSIFRLTLQALGKNMKFLSKR